MARCGPRAGPCRRRLALNGCRTRTSCSERATSPHSGTLTFFKAIKSGPSGRIAVVYYEWAGSRHQSVAVPWTIVGSVEDANAFANALSAQPILPEAGTSISASLVFAERLFPVSGARGLRRAIDISGDGPNNDGPPVAPVRSRIVAKGITINGLPIELMGAQGSPTTTNGASSVVQVLLR